MKLQDKNNDFMPHWLSRRTDGTITSAASDVVHALNGDESCVFYLNGTPLNATYIIEGSANAVETDGGAGADWFPILCYPYTPASTVGSALQASQPIYTEFVNAATTKRLLCAAVGGLRRVRVRLTTYATGNLGVSITSDSCTPINPYVRDQKASTLLVTAVAASGVATAVSLPAVAGMRHYVDFINVTFSPTAATTASATPVTVTTANLPGNPAITVGLKTREIGDYFERALDFGASGLSATAAGTATSVSCPAITGVISRVTVVYRLGL